MKKVIVIILALSMLAAVFSVTAMPAAAADEESYASVYSGEMDISWYDKENIQPEYHLKNADQLAGFSHLVGTMYQSFENVTVYLDCDVIWNEGVFTVGENGSALYNGEAVDESKINHWEPIGDREVPTSHGPALEGCFLGSFDGQGHVVSGLYVKNDSRSYAGFFAIFAGKELKNLSIINSYISGKSHNGSFAGFCTTAYGWGENKDVVGSAFSNLYSNATVVTTRTDSKDARSGGIVGMQRSLDGLNSEKPRNGHLVAFKNCWYDGTLWTLSANRDICGILGYVASDDKNAYGSTVYFENCLVTGSVYSAVDSVEALRIGYIVGCVFNGAVSLKNCVAAFQNTNITAANRFKADTMYKGVVSFFAGDVSKGTFENVFYDPIELLSVHNPRVEKPDNANVVITGAPTADDGLALSLAALASNDAIGFDATTMKPYLKNVKTVCDPVKEDEPIVTEPVVSETEPTVSDTEPTVSDTEPSVSSTEKPNDPVETPAATTALTTTAPTTTAPAEKSCGSMNIAAVAAIMIAVVGSAVIVFKRK